MKNSFGYGHSHYSHLLDMLPPLLSPKRQRCEVFQDGWGLPLRPQLWCSRFTPPDRAPPDSSHHLWRCDESGGVIFITRSIRTPKRCPVGTSPSRTKRQISKVNVGKSDFPKSLLDQLRQILHRQSSFEQDLFVVRPELKCITASPLNVLTQTIKGCPANKISR